MLNIFKKTKQPDENGDILVLKQSDPNACGGTDATLDLRAPREIASEDMILFHVTSALPRAKPATPEEAPLRYVSAFAAPAGDGTFLFLQTGRAYDRHGEQSAWGLVKEAVFPALTALVRAQALAKNNGFHSTTHGLPEGLGGRIDIRYAGGERIHISNNQSPVLTRDAGAQIAALFARAMEGEAVPLPPVSDLQAIRFRRQRQNGGFTRATLTLCNDGTGLNQKEQRFDDPTVYAGQKDVSAETVAAIKKNIEDTGLLAWAALPDNGYAYEEEKTLTFVFRDGTQITVPGGRAVPDAIENGFFMIELEMTTKH